jgi:hypothetical protein
LNHEVLDDAMELRSLKAISLLASRQLQEVLRGLWNIIAKQSDHNSTLFLAANLNVEVDLFGNGDRVRCGRELKSMSALKEEPKIS